MDADNPVHAMVLQELASYGVQIKPEMLFEGKDGLNRVKQFFSPKGRTSRQQKNKIQTSESSIFGVELAEVPMIYSTNFGLVPKFLNDAFRILERHLEVQGLFRVSGSKERIRRLREKINQNDDISDCQPGDLSNLVQQFFGELPTPLITRRVWNVLTACQRHLADPYLLKRSLARACLLLPTNNLSALRLLTDFLARVAGKSSQNRMDFPNLAVVFAPSLLRSTSMTVSREKAPAGLSAQTSFVEVELVQILLEGWRNIGELPGAVARVERRGQEGTMGDDDEVLHGFGSAVSPLFDRKRKLPDSVRRECNVTFSIPEEHERSSDWTVNDSKRIKMSNHNETTTVAKKKGFLKFFGKKRKSNAPMSLTLPEQSVEHTALGETMAQVKGQKHLWQKILNKIKKPKNKNKTALNLTSGAGPTVKENIDPDMSRFAWPNYFDVATNRYRSVESADSNPGRPRHSELRHSLYAVPDFRKCPITLDASRRGERLRRVERLLLEEQREHLQQLQRRVVSFAPCRRTSEDELEDAELDDDVYDEDDYEEEEGEEEEERNLVLISIDSFDEPHEMTHLSEALAQGTYCGEAGRNDGKTSSSSSSPPPPRADVPAETVYGPKEKEPSPEILPLREKTSMKSLDSGVGLRSSDDSGSSPEVGSRNKPENKTCFKSPLALTFQTRRTLVFDSVRPFDTDF